MIATKFIDWFDFLRAKYFVNDRARFIGYGIVVTPKAKEITSTETDENGNVVDFYNYYIGILIETYQGYKIIEEIGKYDQYTETLTLYNSNDIDYFNEEFMTIVKAIKNNNMENYKVH